MTPKILYVITKANWGGAQRYVYDMAVAARDRGEDVAVAMGGTGRLADELEDAGVRTIFLPLRQRRSFIGDLFTFGSFFTLLRLFRTEQPSIVHVNSAKAGGLGSLAARFARVPRIIFTAHGWEFNAPRPLLSRIGIAFFSWITILLSHTTICVSDAVRRSVAWMPGAHDKLVVIHNGIQPEPLLARNEARHRLIPHFAPSVWIGMTSELHPTKRIEDAICAFARIASNYPDSALVVIGEGEERMRLENLIRHLSLEKRIVLAGQVVPASQYMNAFDLFIHSAQSEALGFAILEAGCAALPIIATCVGGIPEIIPSEEYGLLVPPRDPDALAIAIKQTLENLPAAHQRGIRLQARIRKEFSRGKMIAETTALYG